MMILYNIIMCIFIVIYLDSPGCGISVQSAANKQIIICFFFKFYFWANPHHCIVGQGYNHHWFLVGQLEATG